MTVWDVSQQRDVEIVVLLGCGKAKASTPCPAVELYVGQLYRAALAYVRQQYGGPTWIMSAKHGLLGPDVVTEPYEATLSRANDRHAWTHLVGIELLTQTNPGDVVVAFAGEHYVEWAPALRKRGRVVELPLEGMTLGQRMQWLRAPARQR